MRLPPEVLRDVLAFYDRDQLERLEIVNRLFRDVIRRDFKVFPKTRRLIRQFFIEYVDGNYRCGLVWSEKDGPPDHVHLWGDYEGISGPIEKFEAFLRHGVAPIGTLSFKTLDVDMLGDVYDGTAKWTPYTVDVERKITEMSDLLKPTRLREIYLSAGVPLPASLLQFVKFAVRHFQATTVAPDCKTDFSICADAYAINLIHHIDRDPTFVDVINDGDFGINLIVVEDCSPDVVGKLTRLAAALRGKVARVQFVVHTMTASSFRRVEQQFLTLRQATMESFGEAECRWLTEHRAPWWAPIIRRCIQQNTKPLKHIAFIMDGNRRYARTHRLKSISDGHHKGYEQLMKILVWCYALDICEITVFAFSIDNFQRDETEVSDLLNLGRKAYGQLLQYRHVFKYYGVGIRFAGDHSYFPADVQEMIVKAEEMTSSNSRLRLTICISYTSQDEIARAMDWIRRGVQRGLLDEKDITARLINDCMDTSHCSPVDMLVRTSGEHRLSDFLLWQCAHSYIHIESVLWPNIGFWHVFKAFLAFHRARRLKSEPKTDPDSSRDNDRVSEFLDWMNAERQKPTTNIEAVTEETCTLSLNV